MVLSIKWGKRAIAVIESITEESPNSKEQYAG